jgi:hypothetical protein
MKKIFKNYSYLKPFNYYTLQSPCPSVHPSVRSHFRNRYLSLYWKKWFYIWYMALARWLVPCLPFPGLPHIYFLFTVRLTNEWVGVFLARRSVQHLVWNQIWLECALDGPTHFIFRKSKMATNTGHSFKIGSYGKTGRKNSQTLQNRLNRNTK